MKRHVRKWIKLLLLCILAVFLDAPAVAQEVIKLRPEQRQLDPNKIKVYRRKPIPFKPFEPRDPTTGRPPRDPHTGKEYTPDTEIQLPNGKRMAVRQYFEELNRLEQEFNQLGYTLRDPRPRIKLQETIIPQAQFKTEKIAKEHLKFNPTRMTFLKTLPELETEHAEETTLDTTRLAPIAICCATQPTSTHTLKTWDYALGDPSIFSAHINGRLELTGTRDATKFNGEVNGGGSIFNNSKEILHATGSLNAPQTGTMNATLVVSVFGSTVYNLNQNASAAWSKTDSVSKGIDWSTSINFALGPIPMSATIGAQGSVGISYGVYLRPVSAKGQITPNVRSSVYAQAGANIGVGGAGAGANMTLLNDDLNFGGEVTVGMKWTSPIQVYVFEHYYCLDVLDVLSGNVYAYAYIWVPEDGWKIWNWEKKEWDWTIWSWPGFHVNGYVFNDTKTTTIGQSRFVPLK